MENYKEQGREHIGKDKEVDRKEVGRMEKKLNRHTKCILGFLKAGEELGKSNASRVKNAFCSETGVVPVLATHIKDHKPPPSDPKTGILKSRGICKARSSINTRISDLLSDIIVPIVSR